MLSLVQNLEPPAGVYNLGTHRATVKKNQIATIIYALKILNRFTSLSVRGFPRLGWPKGTYSSAYTN